MQKYERKSVSAASLFDFCRITQEMQIDGWRFNFEENDLVPINYGMMIYCVMEKPVVEKTSNMGEFTIQSTGTVETIKTTDETEALTEVKTENVADALTEVKTEDSVEAAQDQPVRRGRKPKAE